MKKLILIAMVVLMSGCLPANYKYNRSVSAYNKPWFYSDVHYYAYNHSYYRSVTVDHGHHHQFMETWRTPDPVVLPRHAPPRPHHSPVCKVKRCRKH